MQTGNLFNNAVVILGEASYDFAEQTHMWFHSSCIAGIVEDPILKNLSAFYEQLVERIKALPGVRDSAVQMCSIPKCGWNTAVHVFGQAITLLGLVVLCSIRGRR